MLLNDTHVIGRQERHQQFQIIKQLQQQQNMICTYNYSLGKSMCIKFLIHVYEMNYDY